MNDDGHLDDVDLKSSSDAGSVEEAMQVGVVLEHVADNANAVYDMELTNVAPVDDGNGLPDDAEPATPVAEDRHAAAAADAAVGGPTGQHHGHCYHCSYAGVDCFGAIPTPAVSAWLFCTSSIQAYGVLSDSLENMNFQ